jgi:hypothetical protein
MERPLMGHSRSGNTPSKRITDMPGLGPSYSAAIARDALLRAARAKTVTEPVAKPEVWKVEGACVYRLQDAGDNTAFYVNEFTITVSGNQKTTTRRHHERLAQRICYLLNEDHAGE